MIRVLQVVHAMNRNGLESFIMNVYRNIDRNKVQFDFLVHIEKECAFDSEIGQLGGKIYRVPARNQGVLKNKRELKRFFSEHPEYKIVHMHASSTTYIEPLVAAVKSGVPTTIMHSHNSFQGGSPIHKYIHKFNKRILKKYATHYFSCSEKASEWMYGNDSNKAIMIPNGIDTDAYAFNKEIRTCMRMELGIDNKLCICNVGRFHHAKNHNYILEIFKTLHEQNPNSVLLLVGDGVLKDAIRQKVADFGLENSVIFVGVRSDVNRIMQAADVFLMPSYHEGLPVTLVEAQAAGMPCVVSDVITRQVALSENIKYISLEEPVELWVDSINAFAQKDRISDFKYILEKGFDIKTTSKKLESFYLERGNL